MTHRQHRSDVLLLALVCALSSACTESNTGRTVTAARDVGGNVGGADAAGGFTGGSETGGTAGSGGAGGMSPAACERGQDCDVAEGTAGFVCDSGSCRQCMTDRECQRVPHYGESSACIDGRCRVPDPCETDRSAGCVCDEQRPCVDGLVCDGSGKCVADPCTLPGAEGSLGCACPASPMKCQPGLQCAPDTMTCVACAGEAGCPCPCDEGLTCGPDGVCSAAAGCESPGSAECDCRADGTCDSGLFCDGNTCRACIGSREPGCPCEAGACVGLVCDVGLCRRARDCGDAASAAMCGAANRRCEIGADSTMDARCGACALGFVERGGVCERDVESPARCEPGHPDDISQACEVEEHRDCVVGVAGAACGACLAGYVEAGGICELQRDCESAGCTAANRECRAEAGAHAECLGCRAGYEVPRGCVGPECTCEPIPGLSCVEIMPSCAVSHRRCDDADGSAECTVCEAGYVVDAMSDGCRPRQTCGSLDCEGNFARPCVQGGGAADDRCDLEACLPGYVAPLAGFGACVLRSPCNPSPCRVDQTCREANGTFTCEDPPCADGSARDRATGRCVVCPANLCNGVAGVTGRLLAENGNCLCETRENYYWDVVAGALSCDEDADGWVSYVAYQHQTNAGVYTASVRDQARCTIRTVDRFILQPENEGDALREVLTQVRFAMPSIALVETQRNDRASALAAADPATRPAYAHPPALAANLGARGLAPQELNPLTKYCVDEQGDFNDDGAPDISQGQADAPSARLTPEMSRVAAELSYFAELHVGYYLPPEPAAGFPAGRYVIAERSRLTEAPATQRIAPALPPDAGGYWRSCPRFRDANADPDGTRCGRASYDFCSDYDAGARVGMTHHSQFKCMAVARPARRELGGGDEVDYLVSRAVAAQRFTFNACVPSAGPSAVPAGVARLNPQNVAFDCTILEQNDRLLDPNTADGFVAWALVPYTPYGGQPTVACADQNGNDDNSRCAPNVECLGGYCQDPTLVLGYTRGCVNECEEIDWLNGHNAEYVQSTCGQYRAPSEAGAIDPRFACGVAPFSPGGGFPAVPDSGRLVCGCALSYGGEACSIGCGSAGIDGDVLVSDDFNLATRDGDWLCASFSAADPAPQTDAAGMFSLTGRTPLSPVMRTDAVHGQAADGTMFTLY